MDRIANAGLRYTQFHSTALCSPTRAALITGRNHHSAGTGVVAEQATGYPGYDSIIGPENATIGTILRQNGYATSWFGKNHNTPSYQISVAGPFDQWPAGMGFDYFYGFMGGETDQWTPYLFRNTTQIFPWIGKPGYNLVTDMADEAIDHMKKLNASAPDKPFFVYYVPGATHAPHQPTPEWIEKFKGKFDMGWNALRDQIFANQKRLGVIPANAQLTPWPSDLPRWDTLDSQSQKLFARQAEVFAAYVAYTDHEIGRVIQAVQELGKLDNNADHLHHRRQRDERGRDDARHAERHGRPTGHSHSGRGADEVLRCLGLRQDLSAHGGGVVVGLRHAVQVDQAGGLALRRHPAGHGDGMAHPHQGCRWHS
jgi:arylsulfatase A-like enzyme